MEWKGRMTSWNLRRKISFFMTLTILLTSMITLVVSTVSAVSSMTRQSKSISTAQLRTLASNYADTLEQYQSLAVAMVIEGSVQRYCKSGKSVGEEYEQEAGAVYNYLLNMLNVRSNLNFAVVKKDAGDKYVYKGNSSITDARFEIAFQRDFQESTPAKKGSTVRMSFGNQYFRTGEYTLTIYHPVYSTSAIHDARGMLVLNLSDSLAEHLHEEEGQRMDTELLLVDCTGKIVSVANRERSGETVGYQEKLKGSSGSFQERGMLVIYQKIGKWNYYLVNEIPVLELYRGSMGVMAVLIIVIIGMTLLSITILRRMIQSFYAPVNQVVSAMDDVAEGRLGERISLTSMDADSRKLAEGFNCMMDEIDTLIEQVRLEQHQMEQIRFNALQSQINPHFLYNTLECIHWQAVVDHNQEISTMVKALAQYYRLCLSRGKEIIPLKQELEHIRSYLIIQNMRYDHIVELVDLVSEEYYELPVPKMTLQPLVENAIYHGIRIKEGGRGSVVIDIRKEESCVCLRVSDSGKGMSREKIEEMNRSISQFDENFGYGVQNVNKRIQLIFGKGFGLRFVGNEQGGVTVEICLPGNGVPDKGVI